MSNSYYTATGAPSTSSSLTSTTIRTELALVDTGFTLVETAIGLKAALASPTFTGVVTLPTPFTLGAVSVLPTGTELNFVDGVTSNIQTQLDAKAPLASPTFTGTVTLPTLVGTDTTEATTPTAAAFKTAGGLGVAKDVRLGKDLYQSYAGVGASYVYHLMENTDNTNAGSNCEHALSVGGTSAGDPVTTYSVTGAAYIAIGIDNSDSDKFKICNSLNLGTNDALTITPAGAVTIPGTLTVTGGITGVAALSTAQTFSGGQRGTVTALTSSAASIAINLATNNNFSHTTSENSTLASPSNPVAGQSGLITITQGGTARTLAYNTFWKFAGGTVPTLTATISAVDIFAYYVESGTRATCQLIKDVK